MLYETVVRATWFCRKCEGIPFGEDLRLGGRRVFEFKGLNEIDESLLRCPYCGSPELVIPDRVG